MHTDINSKGQGHLAYQTVNAFRDLDRAIDAWESVFTRVHPWLQLNSYGLGSLGPLRQ
jgi:hypothetical protein